MCGSCQAACQGAPGMYLSPFYNTGTTRAEDHIQLPGDSPWPLRSWLSCLQNEHSATFYLTHKEKLRVAGEIYPKSPVKTQTTNQAPTVLTPLLFIIFTLAGQAFKDMWGSLPCLTSPTSICFLNGFVSLPLWKRTMFYLYLNILQHKMNDYNISCLLSLLSNTEFNLRPRAYHN